MSTVKNYVREVKGKGLTLLSQYSKEVAGRSRMLFLDTGFPVRQAFVKYISELHKEYVSVLEADELLTDIEMSFGDNIPKTKRGLAEFEYFVKEMIETAVREWVVSCSVANLQTYEPMVCHLSPDIFVATEPSGQNSEAATLQLTVKVFGYMSTLSGCRAAERAYDLLKLGAFVLREARVVEFVFLRSHSGGVEAKSASSHWPNSVELSSTSLSEYLRSGIPVLPRAAKGKNIWESYQNSVQARLNTWVDVLQVLGDEEYSGHRSAIDWLMESHIAHNDTMSFLCACIGLEAILGDSNEQMSELSKRLADRYAFLLGRGPEARRKHRSDYEELLNLRGKLVHAKRVRLEQADGAFLVKARHMLLTLIRHELHVRT